jgi:hypothetical protein
MLTRRKKGPPDRAFAHSDDCRILRADPAVQIQWSEVERGHWRAECVCGVETYYEPAGTRVRLDPLDPKTSRHLGECEYVDERDPAVLRVLLKVSPSDGYSWVQCSGCDAGWQVADYAEVG